MNRVKDIVINGLLAAFYVALTIINFSFSYGVIQIRIAEILVILCFFNRKYIIGVTLGCLIANLFSPGIGPIDAVIGTFATFASCLLISLLKHLLFACIVPVIINGFIVGWELYYFLNQPSFWLNVGYVMLGEGIVMIVSYIVFMLLKKKKSFFTLIQANQNVDFTF